MGEDTTPPSSDRPSWASGRARPDQIRRGRHGLSRDEVAELQRERILAATAQLVAREGYEAVRVTDVVALAGVSRKSYYQLFADKEESFGACLQQSLERLAKLAGAVSDTRDDWVDRVRAGLTALLGTLAEDPGTARLCFYEPLVAGPKALEHRNRSIEELAHALHPAPPGCDSDLARFSGTLAVGALSEVLQREIAAGRTSELPELAPKLMYAMVRPVLGAEAAERELARAA
jgi:AcrR family transcriptional regulator